MGQKLPKWKKMLKKIELNISVISNVRWTQTHWIQNK
jgi:hypothetical protein